MKTRLAKVLVLLTLVVAMVAMMALPALAVNPVTVLDGQVTVSSDSATGLSVSGTTVTGNGKVSMLGGTKEFSFVVANTSGSTATISFDYSYSNVDGKSESASSGTKTLTLKNTETYTFKMSVNGGWTGKTGTLKLSNFAIEFVSGSSNVTVSYNNSLGSVTAAGSTVASGAVLDVSASEGVTLTATNASGAKFLAWVNMADNSVLSTSASYTLMATENMTVRAVFAKSTAAPVFFADGTAKVFEGLDAAISYASSASNKTITLASDATLAAGNYTIPAGIILNIPYNAAGTVCTTAPTIHDNAYTAPSVFRTLNMANGANLTVNGTLSLSAQMSSKYGYNGAPSGPLPFIKMETGSKITVEDGAAMYVYGFVTGSGSVEVKSGGTVYECFQIADYRGGDATSTIVGKDDEYGVFPFNQYYIQNVEVPMTIHAGAKEIGYTALYVTIAGTQKSDVPFIGDSNSMFVLESGYIVKDYMEGTGRLSVKLYGDVAVSTMSMSMKVSLIGDLNIDSSKYALPIAQHLTLYVESGNITMNQSVAFLPGSELYIREGATCQLGANQKIIIYDLDQWLYNNGANGYSGTTNLPYMQAKYVPGGNGTTGRLKDALIQVDGTIAVPEGSAAYATSGGANVYSTGTGKITLTPGTETVTYQVITNSTDISSWPEIALVPIVLTDNDGTTISADVAGDYIYYASTGKWDKPGHRYEAVVTAPTCTEGGYTTNVCIACGDSYLVENSNTAATGHTEVIDAAVAATCTETGLTEGKHCSVCGEVTVAQENIPMLPHTEVVDAAVDATCTTAGKTEGKHCSVCGEVMVAQEEIPALGHTEEIISGKEATCTDPGLTEGKHCTACGEVLVAQEEIPALGHSYASVVTAPTCTEDGYTTYTCSACNDTYRGNEVEALGHTEVTDAAKAATCTETGLTEGKHCSVCGEVLVAQNEIAALGHTEVIDAAKAATCTETGLTEGKHCSVCGEVLVAQNEIAALGHTEVIDAAKAATCTETGLTEGKHCSVCGEVLVAQEEVAALGHSYGDWVVTAPTYTAAGSQTKTCPACGDVVTEEIKMLDNPVIGWNITLKDNIGVNFVLNLGENDKVAVTVNGETVDFTEENGKFSINVAAAQMMDEIAISVNGLPLANTYSVRKYADTILADPDQSACHDLVKYMLVYGGAAQTYFPYNAENLASNGIQVTPAVPNGDGEVEISDSLSAISFYGATLVHETKTAVRFYFTGSVEGLTFTVNGSEVNEIAKGDMYYVEIAGINPQDLGENVTVVVTDGTNELTVAYSPLDYIVRMYNKAGTSAALVQALYGYYQAAVAYTA